MQLQPETLDLLEDHGLVRHPGRDDHPSHGEWRRTVLAKALGELRRRRFRELLLLLRRRDVEDRAVLRHDGVEDGVLRKDLDEIVEVAARHEQELAAARFDVLQGGERARLDDPLAGERLVIVGSKGDKSHCAETCSRRGAVSAA